MPIAARPATPRTDDQNLGWRHLARRRHLSGEKAAEIVACLNDGTVAGDVCHGRQGIHLLGARNARHHVHGDDSGTPVLCLLQKRLVLRRVEEGNQRLVRRKPIDLGVFRRANLGDDIGTRVKRICALHHGHARCSIGLVGETGRFASPGFDEAFIAQFSARPERYPASSRRALRSHIFLLVHLVSKASLTNCMTSSHIDPASARNRRRFLDGTMRRLKMESGLCAS